LFGCCTRFFAYNDKGKLAQCLCVRFRARFTSVLEGAQTEFGSERRGKALIETSTCGP
jgi:hypothetical protein